MLEKKDNTSYYNDSNLVHEIQFLLKNNQGMKIDVFTKEDMSNIISNGDNPVHIQSLKNKIIIHLKKYHIQYRIAHSLSKKWIIIHTNSFVCHIMSHEAREYYNIENS